MKSTLVLVLFFLSALVTMGQAGRVQPTKNASLQLTVKLFENVPERFYGKAVWMDATFKQINNSKIKELMPGMEGYYLGFVVKDQNGDELAFCHALKKSYADQLLSFKEGDRLRLSGAVAQTGIPRTNRIQDWFMVKKIEVLASPKKTTK